MRNAEIEAEATRVETEAETERTEIRATAETERLRQQNPRPPPLAA